MKRSTLLSVAVLLAGTAACSKTQPSSPSPTTEESKTQRLESGRQINVPSRSPQGPATVAIIRDNNINYSTMVSQALEAALGPGGIANLVHSGTTVLIKPNLVYDQATAVTDWRVVKALVDQIKAVNGGASITIADGSASQNVFTIMNARGFTAANFPGVTFANYNDNTTNPTDTYVLADSRTGASKQLPNLVANADVYIDMPKMKTHYHAGFTGALKNLGIGSGPLPLWQSPGGSAKAGLHHDIRSEIVDHVACRVPDLSLMDAIQAMEGQGPIGGTTVNLNMVLASRDPVALDAVSSTIMGIPPTLITHMVLAANENLGVMDLDNITVTGNITLAQASAIRTFVRANPGDPQGPNEPGIIPYRATTVMRTAPASMTIDGELSEWGYANKVTVDSSAQVKGSGSGWGGVADGSAVAQLLYDTSNLYLAVTVKDANKLVNSGTGSAIVNGDGIELYLSTFEEQYKTSRTATYGSATDYRLAISYAAAPQAYMLSHSRVLTGAVFSTIDTSDGYIIEAMIPWSNFGSPSVARAALADGFVEYRQMGLNLALNDADASPSTVEHKLIWNNAKDSDIETNPIKTGMSYLDPPGGKYPPLYFTLTTSATGGTITVEPNQSSYAAGTVVTLTATPDDEAVPFSGWSGSASGTQNPLTITMDGKKTITANCGAPPVLTSIQVSPADTSINIGATQQFSAIGYDQNADPISPQPVFTWTVNGGGTISSAGLFTAGSSAGGPHTVTATSAGISGTASITINSTPTPVYRINCGSTSAAAPFAVDQYASGGTQRTVTNAITVSGVTDPAPTAVYQSERYGNSTYTFPGLTAGSSHTVRLHFAELYQTATGKRVFHVDINGTRVLTSFDIYAAAGGNYRALVREFTTNANASGQIVIQFTTVTDNASITGIEILTAIPNNPPSIVTAAAASPNPVTGTSTALSALGEDDGGEAGLTYTWATTGTPPAAVTFSANGSNAAKDTTATFTKAGTYALQVTVADGPGLMATSTLSVNVDQTLTSVVVAPSTATLNVSGTQQFTATARDQFAASLTSQPTFTWAVSGGGTVSATGLFTAGGSAGGPYTVTASAGGLSGTASVTVSSTPAAIYRINCGSTGAASPFTADQYASGGTQRTVSNAINTTGVTDPAPTAVYQSERYGNSTYTFPGLTAGNSYIVRLHFAELYQTATGKRVFHVNINSTRVLSNFDIYAAAGGNYRALVREFTATANASGQIVVQFTTVTDNASITGIEILASTPNSAPSIVSAAAASPNPVTGTSTVLSALGDDDGGEAGLTYTWATTGTPPAPVVFSANGTNAAKATTATFTKAGTYALQVTVTDGPGLTATSTLSVAVNSTFTSILVSPASSSINTSATQAFTATARDQFATDLATQPTFTWAVSGGGTISSAGLFTAGSSAGGPYTVTATSGTISGTASVTVNEVNTAPTIAVPAAAAPNPVAGNATALSVLGADNGGEANLTYTWATAGTPPAAVTFSANGSNAAKSTVASFTKAGTYNLLVTVKDGPGLTVTSAVAVTVNQTLTNILISPTTATVNTAASRQFTATALDQFAASLIVQPTFTWTVSGGGTIGADGLFTAGTSAGGPYTVTVASGEVSANASVTVTELNTAPTIATPAAATPSPVTGSTTALSVLGADNGGEASLTYTWATTGTPPAAVTFSANGTNAAKNTTATFTKAGSYTFQVTVKDAPGLTVTSSIAVTVSQTLTSIVVSPTTATVNTGATQTFTATARDQFATNLTTPPTFTWTVSGGGTISSAGVFTAGSTAGGPYTVTAASGGKSGTASVTVSGGTTPCAGLCTGPVVFTSNNYQSGNLGTGATCHQTTANLYGGNCSNIGSRTLKVNGTTMSCNGWSLPAKRNGGYCIQVTAGTPSYTSFATW